MSSKIDELNSFHTKLLLDVGIFDVDGDGLLSYMNAGKPAPVTLNKTRLCIPVPSLLKGGIGSHRTAFHPLSEQITEGPSPVLNAYKSYIGERVKATVQALTLGLMELAADSKRHKGMSTKAAKYLGSLGEVDTKTVETLKKVLDSVSQVPEKHLVTIILRNKTDDGSLRQAVVSFPIMDDADTDDTETFFGVKMPRKTKDKALIVSLLDYVLGDETVRATYTSGSKNGNSPYLHSLLMSFHKLASRLNDLLALHAPKCQSFEELKFNLDWSEELETFDEFAKGHSRAVPALPGNTGKEIEERSVYEATAGDVGGDEDLPWNEPKAKREEPEERPTGGSSFRATVDSSRQARTDDDRRSNTRETHGSFRDAVSNNRSRERDDRDTRSSARESSSWRSGRSERDDRGGRGGGRGW